VTEWAQSIATEQLPNRVDRESGQVESRGLVEGERARRWGSARRLADRMTARWIVGMRQVGSGLKTKARMIVQVSLGFTGQRVE